MEDVTYELDLGSFNDLSQSAKMATSLRNADGTNTSREEAADEGEAGKEGSAAILEDSACHSGVLDSILKALGSQQGFEEKMGWDPIGIK